MRALFFAVILIQCVSFLSAPDVTAQTLEYDTDRPGMNYTNFDLSAPDPGLCESACAANLACKAFTYVKPGIQGPNARCWLKSGVPPAKQSSCCVSGVKKSVTETQAMVSAGLETDTNRPGMDYRYLDLTDPNPELCRKACAQDQQCRAFTYVKPGVQGPSARCWLKNGVPPAQNSSCCISGVTASQESATSIPIPGSQSANGVGDKFPVGTSWSVGAYEHGIKQQPGKVPWVFHDDGVVEAQGLWEGQWTLIPEGYLLKIQLFNGGIGGAPSGFDQFLVRFSADGREFTAFKFENGKKGLRYRYGIRLISIE